MKFIRFCIIGLIIALVVGDISGCSTKSLFSVINNSHLKYSIKYLFDTETAEYAETNLYINHIGTYDKGDVIEITLPQISTIPEARLLVGCFYIKGSRIYKFKLEDKEKISNQDLNDSTKMESLISEASIVCQEEPIKDALDQNTKGWHQYLEIRGNQREYHAYNNQIETGYYESFVWDIEKGLLVYKSGFGAEAQSIELTQCE